MFVNNKTCVILTTIVAVISVVNARDIRLDNNKIEDDKKDILISDSSFQPFAKCSFSNDFVQSMGCAAARALKIINEINKRPTLQILPGVSLESDVSERMAKQVEDLNLPEEPKAKTIALIERLLDESAKLVSSKSLKVKMPESGSQELARTIQEGRGKMKKMMMPMLMAMGAKFALIIPILTGGIGLLASKALVIGKIALGITLALLISTIFGSNGSSYGSSSNLGLLFKSLPVVPNYIGGGGWNSGWNTGGVSTSYGVPYGVPPSYNTNNNGYGYGWSGTTNQLGPYARTYTVNNDNNESTEDSQEQHAQELAYSQQYN